MDADLGKLKILYQQLDRQQAAGEDVVAELRKEINNIELTYLKEQVLPQVAQYLASKVCDLRCGIDSSFQYDGQQTINYSFCTSGSMLFIKDTVAVISNSPLSEKNTPHAPTADKSEREIKALARSIRLVEYSPKAVALYGDTKDFSEELKNIGGYFNPRLRGGVGWVFSKKRIPELKELLGSCLEDETEVESMEQKMKSFHQPKAEISSGSSGFNDEPIVRSDVEEFTEYKRYLSSLTSSTGKPYSASSISVYATALRSKYMRAKVSKFAGTSGLEKVSELSAIDKIISEVKYEAEQGIINKTNYLALKMYRDYLRHKSITIQSQEAGGYGAEKLKEEVVPKGKPIGIQSIDAEHIHIPKGELKEMFATFLNAIGPELLYDMKINYMGANLIDVKENPYFIDSCVKLNGGFWVNMSPRPQTIANQIKKICESLDMEVIIIMEHEDLTDGYRIESKPRPNFSLNGGRPLNKRQTVFETVRLYTITYPNSTFMEIEAAFPKELQGGYGVLAPLTAIQARIQTGYDDERRYYLERDKILCSADGIEFAVCNQWGHQFAYFQTYVLQKFNWTIEEK